MATTCHTGPVARVKEACISNMKKKGGPGGTKCHPRVVVYRRASPVHSRLCMRQRRQGPRVNAVASSIMTTSLEQCRGDQWGARAHRISCYRRHRRYCYRGKVNGRQGTTFAEERPQPHTSRKKGVPRLWTTGIRGPRTKFLSWWLAWDSRKR